MKRPIVISIAGFDPSGGAGLLSDIKTFEKNKVMGFGVTTATTVQTEDNFVSVRWEDEKVVVEQLRALLNRYSIAGVKIGLVKNFDQVNSVLDEICKTNQRPYVIWDPILRASSGYDFNHQLDSLQELLRAINLVTPNWMEVQELSGEDGEDGAKKLSEFCDIYLKGGHSNELGKDFLYSKDGKVRSFNMKTRGSEKHGSGCVFSSALLSHIVKDYPIHKACVGAKRYTEKVLSSNKSKLGYHV